MMHILSYAHIFIPGLILYLCNFKRIAARRHILIWIMALIVLLINSFWLAPFFEFYHYKGSSPEMWEFGLQIDSPSEILNVYVEHRRSLDHKAAPFLNDTFFELMLLLLALGGFFIWYREKRRQELLCFAAGTVIMFGLAYFGSQSFSLAQMQPLRFTIPINILLTLPASVCLCSLLKYVFHKRNILTVLFISSACRLLYSGAL